MAQVCTDLLTLIERCSELELEVNLNILKDQFECSDEKISWLPLLAIQLEMYTISTLNLYEKIRMLVEIRKLVPKILKLNADLTIAVKSTDNLCQNHKLDFDLNLTQNLLTHRLSCRKTCVSTFVVDEKPIQEVIMTCDNPVENYTPVFGSLSSFPIVNETTLIETGTKTSGRRKTRFSDDVIGNQYPTERFPSVSSTIPAVNDAKPIKRKTRRSQRRRTRFSNDKIDNQYPAENETKQIERETSDVFENRYLPERWIQTEPQLTDREIKIREEEIEKRYPARIVNGVRSLDGCVVSTARLRPDGLIECLLCSNFTIHENYFGNIKDHFRSKKHLGLVRTDGKYLAEFHKFWQGQTPKIWRSHFQFNYFSKGLKCVVCDACLRWEQVAQHLDGCFDTSAEEKPRGPYPKATENALFSNVPFIQLGESFYPAFQRRHSGLLCSICNVVVTGEQQDHLESADHVALQSSERVQVSLRSYHDVWSSLPVEMHKWQAVFIRGLDKMTCTICEILVEYKVGIVSKHVTSAAHLECQLQKKSKYRHANRKEATRLRHPNPMHWHLFRDLPSVRIGDELYPSFQRLCWICGIEYFCMVCNEAVGTRRDIDRHARTATHIMRQGEKAVQESLVRYHRTWNALPVKMQKKQTQFERGTATLRCTICPETFVDYDPETLREHLLTEPHANGIRRKCRVNDWLRLHNDADLTDLGGSTSKTEDTSVTTLAARQDPAYFVISDEEDTGFHGSQSEPPGKKFKAGQEPAERTFNYNEEKTPPGYVYYDYDDPNFIFPTKNIPDGKSQFLPDPEPSCSYTSNNVINRFHQQSNGRC